MKAPVTVCGLFIVKLPGWETPFSAPLKPVNTKPEFGTANIVAFVPAVYQPAPVTDPPETGTACVVSRNSVWKFPVKETAGKTGLAGGVNVRGFWLGPSCQL